MTLAPRAGRRGELWVGQVPPEVAEKAGPVAATGIEAFSTKNPEVEVVAAVDVVVDPIARSQAKYRVIANVGVDYGAWRGGAIDARLAHRAGTLGPNPLAAGIFPEITERTVACTVIALTAE